MPVRLKDIAADLGVSTVTVSKVLRGNPDISEATRERVLKRMQELNYQPNMLARGLASGRTYTVGLVVPDLLQPFFAEFAKSLSAVLRQTDRALLIGSSEGVPSIEQTEIRTLLSRGVDVLLVASCQPDLESVYEAGNESTPFLLIDRDYPDLDAHFVGSDDLLAGQMATEHLLATGRRRIAHIGGSSLSPSRLRAQGYRNALRAAGIEVDDRITPMVEHVDEGGDNTGFMAMQQLLEQSPDIDAVFCYNDLTAIGAMEAAREAGRDVPGDIAFVGCGNMRYARYLKTPLSSVDHGTEQLGRKAGQMALELAERPETPVRRVLLPPSLVVRESSAARS